jgi:hypothetical protein
MLLHSRIKNSRIDDRSQHTHRQKSPAQQRLNDMVALFSTSVVDTQTPLSFL